jgi:hypothetical protein
MKTFMANLKRAVTDQETVSMGGGDFSPAELQRIWAVIEAQEAALEEIATLLASHPEANTGNAKVHYCLCTARNALKANG